MIDQDDNQDVEDFLEHVGVKKWKWGTRRGGGGGPSNRSLNKASRGKDRAKNDRAIDKARGDLKSGASRQKYKAAKAQYKVDKVNLGSREARKTLQKVKEKNVKDYYKSQEAKSGKETTKAILGAVVGTVLVSSLRIAASSR